MNHAVSSERPRRSLACPPQLRSTVFRLEEEDPKKTEQIERLKQEKRKRDAELLKEARERRRKQEGTMPSRPLTN